LMERNRPAVRRAIAVLSLPLNAPTGLRCLYDTVDLIWRAAGDTATDWNFYTKRTLLAGVYSSTVLYWLDDTSEDFVDTKAFLDRRIDDAMRLPGLLSSLLRPPACFRRPARSYRM
jgi:ubiquinone biosynthesis protein COQ9